MTITSQTGEPTYEELERIANAFWNGGAHGEKKVDGVEFLDVFQHNACNHTITGIIDRDWTKFGFIIDSGDWNGTVVRAWGDPEEVGYYEPPPPPEPRTFIPRNRLLHEEQPAMFKVYLAWRKEAWFAEKERGYNYDRHFQPGSAVEKHYREWAAKKGLEVGYLSDLPKDAQAAIAKATAA